MLKAIFLTILLLCSLTISSFAQAMSSDNNIQKVIKLPLNNWSSQRVLSKALGTMIQSLGIPVEYKDISAQDQWGALPKGVIHLQLEVWQVSMAKDFNRMVQQGYITDLGSQVSNITLLNHAIKVFGH